MDRESERNLGFLQMDTADCHNLRVFAPEITAKDLHCRLEFKSGWRFPSRRTFDDYVFKLDIDIRPRNTVDHPILTSNSTLQDTIRTLAGWRIDVVDICIRKGCLQTVGPLLKLLLNLPKIKHLIFRIKGSSIEHAVPGLCRIISFGNLHSLRIHLPTRLGEAKCFELQPLYTALAGNTTIKSFSCATNSNFKYTRMSKFIYEPMGYCDREIFVQVRACLQANPQGETTVTGYFVLKGLLEHVLEINSTLLHVDVATGKPRLAAFGRSKLVRKSDPPTAGEVDAHLFANQCGMHKIQQAQPSMSNRAMLVDILDNVEQRLGSDDAENLRFTLQYKVLHTNPSLWCHAV